MTTKFSFFIALSLASLFFLFSVTTRAAKGSELLPRFLSHDEIANQLSEKHNESQRAPASIAFAVNQKQVDLRKHDSPIANQFGGTCSAFATAAAMENRLHAKNIKKEVSRRDLWSQYGRYDAFYAVEAATRNFVTELKYWPDQGERAVDYQEHRSVRVSSSTEIGYDFEPAIQALDQGHPVVMAIQVPADLSKCKPVISAKSSRTKGDHVVEAVGYQLDNSIPGGGYFIVKNSWGVKCGDQGYHYYPFKLCQRNDLYCYFIAINEVESR